MLIDKRVVQTIWLSQPRPLNQQYQHGLRDNISVNKSANELLIEEETDAKLHAIRTRGQEGQMMHQDGAGDAGDGAEVQDELGMANPEASDHPGHGGQEAGRYEQDFAELDVMARLRVTKPNAEAVTNRKSWATRKWPKTSAWTSRRRTNCNCPLIMQQNIDKLRERYEVKMAKAKTQSHKTAEIKYLREQRCSTRHQSGGVAQRQNEQNERVSKDMLHARANRCTQYALSNSSCFE